MFFVELSGHISSDEARRYRVDGNIASTNSLARLLVMPIIPALAAAYCLPSITRKTDNRSHIDNTSPAFAGHWASCVFPIKLKQLERFVSITASQSSLLILKSRPSRVIPALFTNISMLVCFSRSVSQASFTDLIRNI